MRHVTNIIQMTNLAFIVLPHVAVDSFPYLQYTNVDYYAIITKDVDHILIFQ